MKLKIRLKLLFRYEVREEKEKKWNLKTIRKRKFLVAQQVKDPALLQLRHRLQMQCGVQPLVWELPHPVGAARKREKDFREARSWWQEREARKKGGKERGTMGKRENRTGVSMFSAVSARGGAQSIHAEWVTEERKRERVGSVGRTGKEQGDLGPHSPPHPFTPLQGFWTAHPWQQLPNWCWPDTIIAACMSCLTWGGPDKEDKLGGFGWDQEEAGDSQPFRIPGAGIPLGWECAPPGRTLRQTKDNQNNWPETTWKLAPFP